MNKEKMKTFRIPQIPEDKVELRTKKTSFVRSEMVSPMQGPYTKDVNIIPDQDYHQDIDTAYDAFRVEPKMTKEAEIKIHGRAYHEFPDVSSEFSNTEYVKKEPEKKEEKVERIGFKLNSFKNKNDENLAPEQLFKEEEKVEPVIKEELVLDPEEEKELFFNNLEEKDKYVEDNVLEPIEEPIVEPSIPKTIITYGNRQNEEENVEIKANDRPVFENIIHEEKKIEPERKEYQIPKKEEKIISVDKYSDYVYPPLGLIDAVNSSTFEIPDWIYEKKEIINQTLHQFGVDAEVESFTYGPRVTRYEVKLAQGVYVKKVLATENNLLMNLCAKSIRIQAPIPGKNNVGIEVPNDTSRVVQFGELVFRDDFTKSTKPLLFALGLNISGKPIYLSVPKMIHALIAGGTGSGKSVCMNSLLISILLKNTPDDVRFIMVDPKKVELANYADIPHLLTPVITDPKLASEALKWACTEMDRRYNAFPSMRVRDIETFNNRVKETPSLHMKKLPYIVVIIDELADLMMTCQDDVEDSIKRIAQMGRAAGIHIIVATQRPTTDIVSGNIKTNIPTRIAFKLAAAVDSITILDQGGAETLLGHGDMLYKQDEAPERIQGAYLTDEEIIKVTDFIRAHYEPDYLFTHEALAEKTKQSYGASQSEDMSLVYSIASFVVERGSCSINSIQSNFNLGFNRAQKIVDMLEEMGVVSPKKGPMGRDITMNAEEVDNLFSNLEK